MTPARRKALRQYVVYHLKEIELLHLFLFTNELTNKGAFPENVMGHKSDRFKETLLSTLVTVFMTIADERSKSTHVKTIWQAIYPRHARAIERIWSRQIAPGVEIMKHYRDSAGAHGDEADKYFVAKIRLVRERTKVVSALQAFLNLSIRLTKKQAHENPNFEAEVESVLLDIELKFSEGAFNRRWLREMQLIPTGAYSKRF